MFICNIFYIITMLQTGSITIIVIRESDFIEYLYLSDSKDSLSRRDH